MNPLWKAKLGGIVGAIAAHPHADLVLVGSFDGVLTAFSLQGRERWKASLGGVITSVCADRGGRRVFATGFFGKVYALDTHGDLLWEYELASSGACLAVGADARVYAGTFDGTVVALDPEGKLLWKVKTLGVVSDVDVAEESGHVCAGSYDQHVYVVNRSGELIGRKKANDRIFSVAISADGCWVAATARDRHVYGFNPESGKVWTRQAQDTVQAVTAREGRIAAPSFDGALYIFDLTGDFRGLFKAGAPLAGVRAGAGPVFLTWSREGRVFLADGDGFGIWEADLGQRVFTAALSPSGAFALFGHEDGTVQALGIGERSSDPVRRAILQRAMASEGRIPRAELLDLPYPEGTGAYEVLSALRRVRSERHVEWTDDAVVIGPKVERTIPVQALDEATYTDLRDRLLRFAIAHRETIRLEEVPSILGTPATDQLAALIMRMENEGVGKVFGPVLVVLL